MPCRKCGMQIPSGVRFCSSCGTPVGDSAASAALLSSSGSREQVTSGNLVYPKNPPLSPHLCWVNVLLPGLAQIIHGQVGKGIGLAVASVILLATMVGTLGIMIGSIIDAYKVGAVLKRGQPIGKWDFFPS